MIKCPHHIISELYYGIRELFLLSSSIRGYEAKCLGNWNNWIEAVSVEKALLMLNRLVNCVCNKKQLLQLPNINGVYISHTLRKPTTVLKKQPQRKRENVRNSQMDELQKNGANKYKRFFTKPSRNRLTFSLVQCVYTYQNRM